MFKFGVSVSGSPLLLSILYICQWPIIEMLLYINGDSLQLLKGEVCGPQHLVKCLLYICYQPLLSPSPPWRLGEIALPSNFLFCEDVSLSLAYFLDSCCCCLESRCIVRNDHPKPRSPCYKSCLASSKILPLFEFWSAPDALPWKSHM